jgi:hypothetical protein
LSTAVLARGFERTVHLIHRPVSPPPGMTIAELAGWHAAALRERFGEPVDVMGTSGGGITAPPRPASRTPAWSCSPAGGMPARCSIAG